MAGRLDLLTGATEWLRSSVAGSGASKKQEQAQDGRVRRVPEAETRAIEIQTLLRQAYPVFQWSVTFELQPRDVISGPPDNYVIVKGLRRDGSAVPPIRIHWRDAANTPASKLFTQIKRGLKLGN